MAKQSQNNLSVGQTLKTVAGAFKLLQSLGKGATGEVFKAQSLDGKLTVAIKVMLHGDLPSDRKTFIAEGLILPAMRQAEKKQKDDVYVTPDYYGADGEANPPYLIEELMTGKRLSDMLDAGHYLPEVEVVAIGHQLFHALDLLSKALKKNFIDLKLENLWWDANKRVLKITDWGTLEDANAAGDARDALRAGLFLYRFATGRVLTEIKGIINQPVDSFAVEWDVLSWGMQETLRRLLHPNPAARVGDNLLSLATAEEISQAFKTLDELWQSPADELIKEARGYVDDAKEANAKDEVDAQTSLYRFAKTALDIAARRNIENKENARLNEIVKGEADYFGRAHGLYEAGSFVPARHLFRIGARLLLSSRLRRWSWLAFAGELAREKNYKKVKENVEQAVELMENEQFEQAGDIFDDEIKKLPSEALQSLLSECRVFFHIQQAKSSQGRGDFKAASQSYRLAHEVWLGIPEHDEWKFQVGELAKLAEMVNQEGLNQDVVRELIAEASSNILQSIEKGIFDFDAIALPFSEALVKSPGNTDVYNALQEIAQEYFERGELVYAAKTLELGGSAKGAPLFASSWRYPNEIRHLLEKDSLENVGRLAANLGSDRAALPVRVSATFLNIHFNSSLHEGNMARARKLAHLISIFDPELALQEENEIIKQEVDMKKSNKEQVTAWILEAERLLFPFQRDSLQGLSVNEAVDRLQNRLEQTNKALEILEQARGYEIDQGALIRIDQLAETGTILKTKFEKEHEEKSAGLNADKDTMTGQLEGLIQRLEQLKVASASLSNAALPAQVDEGILNFKIELISKAYDLCSRALQIAPQDQALLKIKERLEFNIKELGDRALFVIAGESFQAMRETVNRSLLTQANEHFQSGKLDETLQEIKKMELFAPSLAQSREFEILKQKALSVLRMRSWDEEYAQILNSTAFDAGVLRGALHILNGDMDASLIRNSKLVKYLDALRNNLLDQFVKVSQTPSAVEYIGTLQKLVWVDNLYRLGCGSAKGAKMDNWVNYVKFGNTVITLPKKNIKQKLTEQLATLPIFTEPEFAAANLKPELFVQASGKKNKPVKSGIPYLEIGLGGLLILLVLILVWMVFGKSIIATVFPPTSTPTEFVIVPPPLTSVTPEPPTAPVLPDTPIPSVIPSSIPTQVTAFQYCAVSAARVRIGPSTTFSTAKDVNGTELLLKAKTCLNFDARVSLSDSTPWLRIAPGEMLNELLVGGYWVYGEVLTSNDITFTTLIPMITLTPTVAPSQTPSAIPPTVTPTVKP